MSKSQKLLPNKPVKTIGIIGAGPRGLSALENLYQQYAKQNPPCILKTLIFEATGNFGSGQVYTTKQLSSNWLNLSDRALTIDKRPTIKNKKLTISAFPSYHKWINFKAHKKLPDTYASRAVIGTYLNQRFSSIYTDLKKQQLSSKITTTIETIEYINDQFYIQDKENCYTVDEVLLTIGHQQIEMDKQLQNWTNCVQQYNNLTLVTKPYPIKKILSNTFLKKENKIAIRGFGLAMIDIARAIALASNCKFINDKETLLKLSVSKGKNTPTLIPFSLDGLPMAPKPLNEEIDNWFVPSEEDFINFKCKLKLATTEALTIKSCNFLTEALASIIANVFLRLKGKTINHNLNKSKLTNLIENWIKHKKQVHFVFINKDYDAFTLMQNYVQMATGTKPITLEYCIGQVWRHLQPTIYKLLSYSNFSENVISKIIEQDEIHKRLTFGPPVKSIQQLIAMVEANIIDLSVVNNPAIRCNKTGWKLKNNETTIITHFMINSILSTPQILKVNTPLVKGLLNSNYFEPVHSKLGIETFKNGLINLPNTNKTLPIALLGRLAKGTVIGVDAILECFGIRQKYWAKDVVERLSKLQ